MRDLKSTGRKLPAKQLVILAVARFAEPLALTSVFPYLPEMIQSFGVKKTEVARWAGLTGAVFSIAQSCTAVPWGLASDRIGRKPTILIGLVSTMICFVIWGMSTSLSMAIAVRAIQGAGNGNVGIIRTMVAEMVTDKEQQPRAFSLMPLVWSIGSVFGPAFGGFFARPAEQYPNVFGDVWFFKQYPFVLPNLIACIFFLISVVTATLFLKETLESKRHAADWGLKLGEKLTRPFRGGHRRIRHHRPSFVDGEATAPLLPRMVSSAQATSDVTSDDTPVRKQSMLGIFNYLTTMNLICYAFLALHCVAYDQLLPVFLNFPHQERTPENTQLPLRFATGFGLSSDKIGTIFTFYGIVCGVVQFVLFPPLCNRFGTLNCYRCSALVFPLIYILTPYTALVESERGRYVALMAILLFKASAVIMGFPCITIMLTNSASSLAILGTLNGFATTTSGVGRAIGPAAAGSIFTWGVERGYIIAGWWFLAAVAVVGAIPPWFISEPPGPNANESDSDSDSEIDDDNVFEQDDDEPPTANSPLVGECDHLFAVRESPVPSLMQDEDVVKRTNVPSYGATLAVSTRT